MRVLPILALLASACGGDSSKGDDETGLVDDCGACSTTQICVMVFADETTASCQAIPDECGSEASCTDDACAVAMFEACPEGGFNTGCSDTFPPTVISCNP